MSDKQNSPKILSSSQSSYGAIRKDKNALNKNTANHGMDDIDKDNSKHDVNHQIAYGKLLRTRLLERLSNEKIKREKCKKDPMDQLALLINSCKQSLNQLYEINERLKDMSLKVEEKRPLDPKSNACTQFCELTQNFDVQEVLDGLATIEQTILNRCETRNFYSIDKETAYKKILNAVNGALSTLENIKENYKTGGCLRKLGEETIKNKNIQKLCEKVLIQASEILDMDV